MHTLAPILEGEILEVFCDSDAAPLLLRMGPVVQRNWARVGAAAVETSNSPSVDATRKVFVKQFVDARGAPHPGLQLQEHESSQVAAKALRSAEVVERSASNTDQVISVYPWHDIVTLDRLLRDAPDMFESYLDLVGRCLASLATECASGVRYYPGYRSVDKTHTTDIALLFKGLEVRNIGIDYKRAGKFVLFDLGPLRLRPLPEVCGRLAASMLFLAWGRPLRLFCSGPRAEWLSACLETARVAGSVVLAEELEREWRRRSRDPQGRSSFERLVKRFVMGALGRRYTSQGRRLLEEKVW